MHDDGTPAPVTPVRRHLRIVRDRHGGDLEKACVHCGACCYAKVKANDVAVLVKSLRCKFLAVDATGKSRCSVYADRERKAPWCHSLHEGIAKSVFPQACPYVATLRDYSGPVMLSGSDYRAVEQALRDALRGAECPEWADPKAWQAFTTGDAT